MCVVYDPEELDEIAVQHAVSAPPDFVPKPQTYQDYAAPIVIIRSINGKREMVKATYGMIPKAHMRPGLHLTTMNARAESIGEKPTYSKAWKAGQLCLVPMKALYEPSWETGAHVRWRIGMADGSSFCVAGLWREWDEPDGSKSVSFTQITINADDHTLMNRFHRPGEEKRMLVVIKPEDYQAWLECRDPELARSFLTQYPAHLMTAAPAEMPPRKAKPMKPKPDQDPASDPGLF